MSRPKQDEPAEVVERPTQGGDIRARWAWVEASVWSDRMLTALEEGVKGGIWFSLIDKVYAPANLRSAADKVAKNGGAAGVDHVTVEDFGKRRDEHLRDIHEQLRHGVLLTFEIFARRADSA